MAQAAFSDFIKAGGTVQVVKADVCNLSDVARLLAASDAPLRGIIHAAGLLDDGVLTNQSLARFEKVMAPKVQAFRGRVFYWRNSF
jgi:short-subunit dehydrogenase